MKTKTFRIPVSYEMYGYVEVQATDLDDAIAQAEEAPLPTDPSYVEGSFRVDYESSQVDYEALGQ
jgi:hypothetical protein